MVSLEKLHATDYEKQTANLGNTDCKLMNITNNTQNHDDKFISAKINCTIYAKPCTEIRTLKQCYQYITIKYAETRTLHNNNLSRRYLHIMLTLNGLCTNIP